MTDFNTVVFPSDLGWMCVAWRRGQVWEVTFGHSSPDQAVKAMRCGHVVPGEPRRGDRAVVHRLQKFACRASDDLADIDGIGRALAKKIYDELH